MVSDDERREVAERLRRAWANVPDKNSVRHHMRVLYEIYAAVGLNDDGVDAIDLFDRLADLIEPDEPKVKCVAEVKVDGEQLEKLVHDVAVEYAGVDREALLALADEIDRKSNDGTVNPDPMRPLATSLDLFGYARRIREACGEEGA